MKKVKVRFQDSKEVAGESFPIQFTNEAIIECEDFNLAKAVGIINGQETDMNGNSLPGFMVGDDRYFRALEVVSIEVLPGD